MMGTWMPETCIEDKLINILKTIVHIVVFICELRLVPNIGVGLN